MSCRPLLTGGSAVFRRDANHLQIGTNPGWVVNEQPGLLGLLRKLDGVKDVSQLQRESGHGPHVSTIIDELISTGLVVDASCWTGGPGAEHQGNLARGNDPSAVCMRSGYRVAIIHDGAAAGVAARIRALAHESGLSVATGNECDLVICCSIGEPDRTLFQAASENGVDQLRVVIDGPAISCGPFVRPARWPCLACYDNHRADWDPAWPALLHQRVSRPPGGMAISAILIQLVSAYVVDDAVSVAENRTPATYACQRTFGPDLSDLARYPIAFHPDCVCTRLLADAS